MGDNSDVEEVRPLGWPDFFPVPTAEFIELDDESKQRYIELREHIGSALNQPDGLVFVLNAIVAESDEMILQQIHQWMVAVITIEPRDLNAMCYGTPPHSPQRIIASHVEMWRSSTIIGRPNWAAFELSIIYKTHYIV